MKISLLIGPCIFSLTSAVWGGMFLDGAPIGYVLSYTSIIGYGLAALILMAFFLPRLNLQAKPKISWLLLFSLSLIFIYALQEGALLLVENIFDSNHFFLLKPFQALFFFSALIVACCVIIESHGTSGVLVRRALMEICAFFVACAVISSVIINP